MSEYHVHHHYAPDGPALARIEKMLALLLKQENIVMTTVAELTDSVKNEETVGDSLVTLVKGLKTQLDAAGTDPVALKALSDDIDAHAATWAQAVVENTPATPPPAA